MDGTFLEKLRAAAAQPRVLWNVFLAQYRTDRSCIFIFVEGKRDQPFYRPFLEKYLAGFDISFCVSGNRDAVLSHRNRFVDRFGQNPRVLFFVDKDHCDILDKAQRTDESLFVTDVYSIENYLCEKEVVRRYCSDTIGISDVSDVMDEICDRYEAGLRRFHEEALPVMAWIIAAQMHGHKVNCKNIKTHVYFFLEELTWAGRRKMTEFETFAALRHKCGGNAPLPPIPTRLINEVKEKIVPLNAKAWMRGKQELWYTVEFLNKIRGVIGAKGIQTLTINNSFEILKVTCPVALRDFLLSISRKLSSSSTTSTVPA